MDDAMEDNGLDLGTAGPVGGASTNGGARSGKTGRGSATPGSAVFC
jgi:hypothetical protein